MRKFIFIFIHFLCGFPIFGESRKTSDSACYFGTHAGTRGKTIINTLPRVDCGKPGITQQKCEANGCCFDDTRPNTYYCFFKNNHPSNKNPDRVCDNGTPSLRSNCGWGGISQNECFSRGCYWDDSITGKAFCFYKSKLKNFKSSSNKNPSNKNSGRVCDNGTPSLRSNCGWGGISQNECKSRGCCWDDSITGKAFCFYKKNLKSSSNKKASNKNFGRVCDNGTPYLRSNCGWGGISQNECFSRGCCWDDSITGKAFCFYKINLKSSGIDGSTSKNSERVCDNGTPSQRSNCGWGGISQNECKSRGCCWDDSITGKAFCFYKRAKNHIIDIRIMSCDNGVPFKRSDWGYPGIRKADCKTKGCCWDDSVPNAKFCFHKFKKDEFVSYSERDCEAFGLLKGCNDINIGALGEIQKSDEGLASTFAGRTDVFAHEGGVGASANAHLADINRKLGPVEIDVNVGKVGVEGYATIDKGVGVGVQATLAEAGGGVGLKTPGLGWVGAGAKVGLSADTGIKIGPETEVKILGTGVNLSLSKGLELCFFGSCVWIG